MVNGVTTGKPLTNGDIVCHRDRCGGRLAENGCFTQCYGFGIKYLMLAVGGGSLEICRAKENPALWPGFGNILIFLA